MAVVLPLEFRCLPFTALSAKPRLKWLCSVIYTVALQQVASNRKLRCACVVTLDKSYLANAVLPCLVWPPGGGGAINGGSPGALQLAVSCFNSSSRGEWWAQPASVHFAANGAVPTERVDACACFDALRCQGNGAVPFRSVRAAGRSVQDTPAGGCLRRR